MYSVLLSKIDKSFFLIEDYMKKIIKSTDKVVVIPWSFATETDGDGVIEFFNRKKDKYITPLINLGIKEENIKVLNCYTNSYDYLKESINNSDIMILTGGNPEMFYNKVCDCNIKDLIKNYKKIIIGESAGCELQLENYFITAKNNYYKKFDWYKGFGVINDLFYMDVHSSNNYRYINKLKKVAVETNKKVYAIFNDGALILNRSNNKVDVFGNVKIFDCN